ncbi:hypothetical protein ACIBL5_37725 [Streptomyces sp. NPDC050516]|uniref:hypothetical protein n=1 Tax=Streptomyces sp. NPDC050516 TaxID=3365621 RepID=UPI00379495EB
MAALNASVEAAKTARGENTEEATVHDLPKKRTAKTAANKTPAKATTPAARRAVAKKTAVKKASGRKPRSA